MKRISMTIGTTLGWVPFVLLIASLTVAATASAQAGQSDEQTKDQLQAARAELAEAARRVAELSAQLAGEAGAMAQERIIALKELRHTRPILGIVMAEGEDGAVALAGVTPGGPAARAGLIAGDVLERINGARIEGDSPEQRMAHARGLIGELAEGDEVRLDYRRDGKRDSVTVQAEKMDRLMIWAPEAGSLEPLRRIHERFNVDALVFADPDHPGLDIERLVIGGRGCADDDERCRDRRLHRALRWSGLNLASVTPDLGRYFGTERGALVLSPGQGLTGLQAGDVILEVDATPINGPRELMRALGEKAPGSAVDLLIQRDQSPQSLTVTIPEAGAMRFIAPPSPPAPPGPPRAPAPPGNGPD